MIEEILHRLQFPLRSKPDPAFIAQQLRKPSGSFATEIAEIMNEANKPLYDLTFDVIDLKRGAHILEIGFGNGIFFGELFAKEPEIRVSAIDFSKEMVEAAEQNNKEVIRAEKLNIKQGNSDAIPFGDAMFDAVFCNMVIYFWERPARHLKEIKRVLKPGGAFYTGIRTRETMQKMPFVQFGFNLYSIKDWKKVLEENGFTIVEVQTRLDPEIEVNGNPFRFKSCCVRAAKK